MADLTDVLWNQRRGFQALSDGEPAEARRHLTAALEALREIAEEASDPSEKERRREQAEKIASQLEKIPDPADEELPEGRPRPPTPPAGLDDDEPDEEARGDEGPGEEELDRERDDAEAPTPDADGSGIEIVDPRSGRVVRPRSEAEQAREIRARGRSLVEAYGLAGRERARFEQEIDAWVRGVRQVFRFPWELDWNDLEDRIARAAGRERLPESPSWSVEEEPSPEEEPEPPSTPDARPTHPLPDDDARTARRETREEREATGREGLLLGHRLDDEAPLLLEPADLLGNVLIAGASGCGKSVLARAIVEEAAIRAIPTLALDARGDLASLALVLPEPDPSWFLPWIPSSDEDRAVRAAALASRHRSELARSGLDPAEMARLARFLRVVLHAPRGGPGVHLGLAGEEGLEALADRLEAAGDRSLAELCRERIDDERLWQLGDPLSVEEMVGDPTAGRTPVHVIDLSHLRDDEDRAFVVARVVRAIEAWMKEGEPTSDPRLLLVVDDVEESRASGDPFLADLLEEGPDHGVGCVLTTRRPETVSKELLSSCSTWFLGARVDEEERDRVEELAREAGHPAGNLADRLDDLDAGELIALGPADEGIAFRERWLLTHHQPLGPSDVERIVEQGPVREELPPEAEGPAPSADEPGVLRRAARTSLRQAREALERLVEASPEDEEAAEALDLLDSLLGADEGGSS